MEQAISTIQLRNNVKIHLNSMREKSNETYEEVILRMIKTIEKQKKEQKELLIEGYKEMAEENLKIMDEFSAVDSEGWPEYDWN